MKGYCIIYYNTTSVKGSFTSKVSLDVTPLVKNMLAQWQVYMLDFKFILGI